MRPKFHGGCLVCVLLAASLQAQTPASRRSWPLNAAPPELSGPVARANLIVVSMQSALLRELNSALAQGGPDLAVNSCHIDLIGAIRRVNREPRIQAGRTSHRLRNPTNTPRAWAAPFVEANAGRLAREVEGFVVDLDDRIGILQSIAHRPVCTACHGPAETIPPGVTA